MRIDFILNPVAGNGFALRTMETLKLLAEARGQDIRVYRTEGPGHGTLLAKQLAEDPGVELAVAVGGDGTCGEVAAGLTGSKTPMGIIPAGTGNDFIKVAGIPKDPQAAFEFLLNHSPRPVDTGRVNDQFFLNVCGTGFDVTVLDYAEEEKKKHRGLTPYLLGLLKAISHYKPVELSLREGGKESKEKLLICSIANGRYIGGGIPICPVADITDGMLDLVMVQNVPRSAIPRYLPGLMTKKVLTFRITSHRLVKEVTLAGKGLRINIDGEIRPMDQVTFRVVPHSLLLVC